MAQNRWRSHRLNGTRRPSYHRTASLLKEPVGRNCDVEDRWHRTIRDEHGNTQTVESAAYGKGSRWRARYVDDQGREHARGFGRKGDVQNWLNKQVSDQVTGTWTDPALSGVTFGAMAERWISTEANRSAKTVAGYRSFLDTVVLPQWRDVPLRDVQSDDLQVWITGLSVDGSVRFEGKGLSASRVRQAHQLVGAVLKFAVRARHLPDESGRRHRAAAAAGNRAALPHP